MHPADSLDTVLDKLNGGDEMAAQHAFVTYEPYLRKVVRRLLPAELRPKFDSIDVVQSAYADVLVAFRGGGLRFGSAAQLGAFLVRATRNRFIDRVRQFHTAARRERAAGTVDPDAAESGCSLQSALSNHPRPSEAAAAHELWERLLAACPPEHHRLLDLRRRGASAREIAAETGMHEGSVRRILRDLALRIACEPSGGAAGSHVP
jgi:RNA polymerase sigma-70 factor (ECF subfamily)